MGEGQRQVLTVRGACTGCGRAGGPDHSNCPWMGGAPAGQVHGLLRVHGLLKSGRMRWMVFQQPALEFAVLAGELDKQHQR